MPIQSILVVDDSPTDRQYLTELLAKNGYKVSTADNAEDALAKVKQQKPDLVLMDVVMPGRSGLEAVRELRARACRVPVVLVTSQHEADDIEAAFASGCDDYVVKPIRGPELIEKVQGLLAVRA